MATKTDFTEAKGVVENLNTALERHHEILKGILETVKELRELGFSVDIKLEKANV